MGFSYLRHGVFLYGGYSKAQPLLLTLEEVAPPDLERGVAPLGPPVPVQPPLLGRGVAPLSKLIGHKYKNADNGTNLKVMTNLDSIFKSRDITLPTKVHLVKSMVFPVVMYGCENWTVKKAEHQRIDAFEL